jgi:hypothetical protein
MRYAASAPPSPPPPRRTHQTQQPAAHTMCGSAPTAAPTGCRCTPGVQWRRRDPPVPAHTGKGAMHKAKGAHEEWMADTGQRRTPSHYSSLRNSASHTHPTRPLQQQADSRHIGSHQGVAQVRTSAARRPTCTSPCSHANSLWYSVGDGMSHTSEGPSGGSGVARVPDALRCRAVYRGMMREA